VLVEIQFLGATKEVTGSMTLLTTDSGLKILIDCGFVQNGNPEEMLKINGRPFEFNASEIDVVVASHGHSDHVSSIPLLVKRGFNGKIIATQATADFMAINLKDGVKIMKDDVYRITKVKPNAKLQPLYDEDDVENTLSLTRCYDFDTDIKLDDFTTIRLHRSGHMLGAAVVNISYKDGHKWKTIAFTGDTSGLRKDKPFLPQADKLGKIDYLVCESTYGNRIHEKTNIIQLFTNMIKETCINNGKALLIPSFALMRSSEILWWLREVYIENPEFNKIPIYLDSPMSIKAQKVVDNNRVYWGEKWLERDNSLRSLFDWEVVQYIDDYKESQALNVKNPMIIVTSSGMLTSGRVLMHLENVLKQKGCQIVLVGYQAENTLGRKLLETQHKSISVNRRQVVIRAKVSQINLSSHADKFQLLEFIKTSRKGQLKKIFLNHGDIEACESLKDEIEQHINGVQVLIPEWNEKFILK